ncbi:MAG: hypothetical protein ABL917_00135 [Parcubacteria group bacterium]
MTNTAQRELVAGPSREELFDALRLRHEGRKVTFTVAPSHITGRVLAGGRRFVPGNLAFHVHVIELGNENDGNGTNWLFKLYDEHAVLGSMYLEGYINLTTRKGYVRPATN